MPNNFTESILQSKKPRFIGPKDIFLVHKALNNAKAPVFIFGPEIQSSNSHDYAIKLAQQLNIPVFSTLSSRSAFPNESELFFGLIGVAGHPSAHKYINEEADLIVAFGSIFHILIKGPLEKALSKKTLIVIDVDIEASFRAMNVNFGICAEPGQFSKTILRILEKHPIKRFPTPQYKRKLLLPMLDKKQNDDADYYDLSIRQSEAIAIISGVINNFDQIFYDAGNCAAACLHYIDVYNKSKAIIALGMGGMGYSIGASIGASLGAGPYKRTIAFLGDGAFLMAGLELHTAFELNLPLLFIVFNNNCHGMCVTRQMLFFDGRVESTKYSKIDICQTAKGLCLPEQVYIKKVSDSSSLEKALTEYLAEKNTRPGIIEIKINKEEMPPFTPFEEERPPSITLKGSIKESILNAIKKQKEVKDE